MIRGELTVIEIVEELISKLVDDPSCVDIKITPTESMTLIEVRAGKETGKIIGRGGHLAGAFRTLLESMGTRERVRYEFNILGDGRPKSRDTDRIISTDSSNSGYGGAGGDKD